MERFKQEVMYGLSAGTKKGGCCGEVAVVERWPLWRGGRCGVVAVVERWPLWRGGRCGEVAVVERWPL